MDMYQDGIKILILPDGAMCKADKLKRSPLDINICPLGHETCEGDCDQYEEEMTWTQLNF